MTEQEFERRSDLLRADVDHAHTGWLRHPTSTERRLRYEIAIKAHGVERSRLLEEYFARRAR